MLGSPYEKAKKPVYPEDKEMKIFIKYLIKQVCQSTNKKDLSYKDGWEFLPNDEIRWWRYFQ